MKRFASCLLATLISMAVAGCGQPDTHDADVRALKDLEAKWNTEYAARKVDPLLAHYTDDAVLMAPGEPAAAGKSAVRKMLTDMVNDPAMSLKFQASNVDVAKSGDLGYTQGTYTMTATDRVSKHVINDHGSYVTVYRKQADGSWKAVSDIASSAAPPPAPAHPPAAKAAKTPKAPTKAKKKK